MLTIQVAHGYPAIDSMFSYLFASDLSKNVETAFLAILFLLAVHIQFGAEVLPLWILLILVVGSLALPIYSLKAWLGRRRVKPRTPESVIIPLNKLAEGHVYAYGCIKELTDLKAIPPSLPAPIIVGRMHAPISNSAYGFGLTAIALTACLVTLYLSPQAWPAGFLMIHGAIPGIKSFAMVMHGIRPVYYRVTPGLLELIRGQWRGADMRVEQRVELDNASLVIRYDKRVITVISDVRLVKYNLIGMDGLTEPHLLAQGLASAVLMARAYNVPSMPNNYLMG